MPGSKMRQAHLAAKPMGFVAKVTQKLFLSRPFRKMYEFAGLFVNKFGQPDDLTGLMTRLNFLEQLEYQTRTDPPTSAVVYIDLDRFKPINDSYGHKYGDIILVELARRLEQVMSCVSRHGGDEFVGIITFEHDDDTFGLHDKISAVLGEITRLYYIFDELPDVPVSIQASLGIRLLDNDVNPLQELIDADIAMYHAKRNGGYYTIFSADIERKSRRFRVDSKEHLLLDLNNVDLRYQLIYSMGTACVSMVEASIHLPGESIEYFMSNIERRSVINRPLFLSTFETACLAALDWPRNALGKQVKLSFNLPVELLDGNLRNSIIEIMMRLGIKGNRIQFELLERGKLSGNEEAKNNINWLRRQGIAFYLDDVGEKNANIEILHQYEQQLEGIKIGTTFTLEMTRDPIKRALVQSLLLMGDKLYKNTVVEGVETMEALRLVAPFMPPFVQGYLLHMPEADGESLHRAIHQRNSVFDSLNSVKVHDDGSTTDQIP